MRTRTLLASLGLGSATLLAALVAAPSAIGGAVIVTVADNSFSPTAKTVPQGQTIGWSFTGSNTHTATSNQAFFDSGFRSSGQFNAGFNSAGRFPYHCSIHATMKGSIVVPMKADGTPSTGWTLRWSTGSAPAGRAFDVQFRRQGTTDWRVLLTNTHAATKFYNPAQNGTYEFRARTSNTAAGKESGWSPTLTKQIS
ncbi:hypothetical protein F0U44_15045 [Nocardioides humilatus]|uniref:Blue (type 1) copper domain-containing protein n=1 Tax=Nocardioides humilatus TaxID=2607660 RepID=A0A5B1LDU0_9ACTN|nr:hypothetical protein [Nocardioides humilatus]KAA1417950.1 hypothetical protein F0U44_15045 [Nocardioides humilatus]